MFKFALKLPTKPYTVFSLTRIAFYIFELSVFGPLPSLFKIFFSRNIASCLALLIAHNVKSSFKAQFSVEIRETHNGVSN